MTEIRVGGLVPFTTIDFPGEIAAVVFLQGCPWRCRYCHNSHLLPCRAPGDLCWSQVMELLQRRRGLLDAVVFSGGEPTLQRALPEAVTAVRSLGFKVGLHTAGGYPRRLAALIPKLDWVGLDIKALPTDYPALTGVRGSGERAWQSLAYLRASGIAHEVRVSVHERILPPTKLARLLDRLHGEGSTDIRLQQVRTARMLDPGLGENTWVAPLI